MKRLTGLLVLTALCVIVLATVVTNPPEVFTTGSIKYTMADSMPACTTQAFSWGSSPLLSLSWNAYGDSGAVYSVAIQWADHSQHFDARSTTVLTCTLGIADSVRTTANRHTEQIARPVSQYGRVIGLVDTAANDAAWFVNIDSVRTVFDK